MALALTLSLSFSTAYQCPSMAMQKNAQKDKKSAFGALFGQTAWTFLNPPFDIAVERAGVVEKWRVERGEWWLGKKSGNGQMKMRWLTLLQHDGLDRLMTKTEAAWSAHVQSNSLVLQLSLVVRFAGENLAVGVFFDLPLHLLRLTHVLTKLFLRLNAQPSTVNSSDVGNASLNILRGVYPLGNPLISNLCSILYGQDRKEWRFLGLIMFHNV